MELEQIDYSRRKSLSAGAMGPDAALRMDYEEALQLVEGKQVYTVFLMLLLGYVSAEVCVDIQSLGFMAYAPPEYTCVDPFITNITGGANVSSIIWSSKSTSVAPTEQTQLTTTNSTGVSGGGSGDTKQCTAWIQFSNGTQLENYRCRTWSFNMNGSQLASSMAMEFSLVCDRYKYVTMVNTLFFAGNCVGNMIGMLGDRVGRRVIILGSVVWKSVFTVFMPFSRHVWHIAVIRFLTGFAYGAVFQGVAIISEVVPMQKRAVYGNNFWLMWVMGFLISAAMAYTQPYWRQFRLYYTLLLLPYVLLFVFVMESPRWLSIRGRVQQAVRILTRIARYNRASAVAQQVHTYANLTVEEVQQRSFWHVWLSPVLRKRLIVMSYVQAGLAISYFALTIDSSSISDNIFLNTVFLGVLEVPTGPLAWILSDKLGRRNSSVGLLVMTVACLIANPFIPKSTFILTLVRGGVAIIGKFLLTTAYIIVDVYIVELFPTDTRSSCMFFTFIFSSILTVLAPTINYLGVYVWFLLPNLIFFVSLFLMAILIHFFLPETLNIQLPQTIEEVEANSQDKK